MKIHGVEGLTIEQITDEILAGAKFVRYQWCFSLIVKTFQRGSGVYYLRPGEKGVIKGLPWTILTFFVGWWGMPFGFVYTPQAIMNNLSGGKDVTYAVMNALMPKASTVPLPADYRLDEPLKNPW